MPKLSVITRTCDRAPLLKRAFAALRQAAVPETEWIVVDDFPGGSPLLPGFLAEARAEASFPIRLVDSGAAHRAKAANAGLAAASGELVHFLDDDDTVAPSFYRKTSGFLAENPRFGAVAALAKHVVERAAPDGSFQELHRLPHYPETREAVSLAELAVVQTIAPVAFVARRACIDAAGGFDEQFEVCEDYEFYLRFLARFDIGVLPETLCAFHLREEGSGQEALQNSPASRRHRLEDRLFRNALLRKDLEQGRIGLGWLLALGEMTRAGWRLNLVLDSLQRRSLPRAMLRWLRGSGGERR